MLCNSMQQHAHDYHLVFLTKFNTIKLSCSLFNKSSSSVCYAFQDGLLGLGVGLSSINA
jgi:hypothetical protein